MYTDCNIFVIIHSTFGTNACGYEIKTHVNGRKGRFFKTVCEGGEKS